MVLPSAQQLARKTMGEWNSVMGNLEHSLMWLEMQLVEQLDVSDLNMYLL